MSRQFILNHGKVVKPPPVLSVKEEELLSQYQRNYRIPKDRMQKATNQLSQGERDALERVRETFGWVTILALAYKYFPLYPNRKWWDEARRRMEKLAGFANIRYLLKVLYTIKLEKEAERQRTMEGLSIDTDYNKEKVYQLIQTNQQRMEARRLAKLVLAAQGGEIG